MEWFWHPCPDLGSHYACGRISLGPGDDTEAIGLSVRVRVDLGLHWNCSEADLCTDGRPERVGGDQPHVGTDNL